MKNYTLKGFSSLLLLLFCTALGAQDFKVDGIYYNILSEEDMTVAVTSHKDAERKPDKRYSGVVKIPSTVTYKKKDYKVVAVGASAFNDCSALTSIELSEGIVEIGESAFSGCGAIKEINIPSSVTKIGVNAFYGCSALKTVHIDDLTAWCKIKFSVFSNPLLQRAVLCLKGEPLTEVIIPSDITEIPAFVFYGCKSITSVKIPEGVTKIGARAFADCSSITSIEIPNSVVSIGDVAFGYCSALTSITIPDNVEFGYGVIADCDNLKTIKQGGKILTVEELESKFSEPVYQVVEKQPEFPGGMPALMKYLRDNIQYPRISREENSQGKTFVSFIVSSTGEIRDVEVHKSSGDKYLDKEAERLVKSMPKWIPGMQSGKNVAVQYTLPVVFRLYDGKATKGKIKRK